MEAVAQARAWQEEAKRQYDRKLKDAAEAETRNNEAIKRTLQKTDALEKHVKMVTMRAKSLATTDADSNELYAQLSHICTTQRYPPRRSAEP